MTARVDEDKAQVGETFRPAREVPHRAGAHPAVQQDHGMPAAADTLGVQRSRAHRNSEMLGVHGRET